MNYKKRIIAGVLLSICLISGCSKTTETKYTLRDDGINFMEAEDYASAITAFDKAIQKSSGFVGKFEIDILKYRGEAQYRTMAYSDAVETYTTLIEVNKDLPEYYNMRCLAYAALGDLEHAMADYTFASDKDNKAPGSMLALKALGLVCEDKGEFEKAMSLYNQAITQGLQSADVYNSMGLCKIKQEVYEDALGYFQMGIQLGDNTVMPMLLYNQGVAYEYLGQYDKALECMENYVSAYGSDPSTEREIAFIKSRQ